LFKLIFIKKTTFCRYETIRLRVSARHSLHPHTIQYINCWHWTLFKRILYAPVCYCVTCIMRNTVDV